MDLEWYTERARGFLWAAQTLAVSRGHQRLMPEHLRQDAPREGDTVRISATPLGLTIAPLRAEAAASLPGRPAAAE